MPENTIILFKHENNLRQSIALILERTGYHIIMTDSVNKAMELVGSQDYPLIITDIDMPDTRSILLPKIHALNPSISAIILTNCSLPTHKQGKPLANVYYIEKPVAPERLLDVIGEVINTPQKENRHIIE